MPNVIEEAKSGRASCRTCKKTIAKGELRLGIEAPNAFGDAPSLQWHHLPCAAAKLPKELEEALATYGGEIPDRAALEQAIKDAYAKGTAKPGGLPYADKAPTGRAKCMQCGEPIEKGALRIAIEREIEAGAMVTTGAGYLHPTCAAEKLAALGLDPEVVIEGLRTNSRLTEDELDGVIADLESAGAN